jgi:TolB-like protein/Tfp pilus assembly protein PilF
VDKLLGELKRRNVFRVAGVYVVVGWLLAQVATTLEEAIGLPTWFDGLIVALLIIGLPIAVIFAWAFELTPEGVVRTEAVPEDQSITANTGRKLDVAIIVGLALLGAMIVWQQLSGTPGPSADVQAIAESEPLDDMSIAVLPFDDLSPAGDQEYFSDGISEEILNVLVGVDGLDVTSRTSSFQFKDRELGIPEIAAQLKVRHVLEGSVRKSGSTIRVTAQLIDSSNDKHLWSDTYDRPLTAENVFEIQDDIANAIVAALSDALGVGRIEPVHVEITTRNLDAYELFLQAMPKFHNRVDLDVADELLARAVELDPGFSQAWEVRAALQLLARDYGYVDTTREESQQRAIEYADRAIQLEPDSATAIAVVAHIKQVQARRLLGRHEIAGIIASYDRALAIQPRNAEALTWRGLTFVLVGDLQSALADFETCIRYEPYYRPCVENHYTVLSVLGDDEAANAAFFEALNTSSAKIEFAYFPSLARTGNEQAFKMAMNAHFMLRGWRRHDELWQAYLDPAQDHSELIESINDYLAANNEGLLEIAEFVVQPIGMGWRTPEILVVWDPMMRRYRQGPEFKHFIRESGVFDYWREAGFPPQCRPLGEDDFECD